MGHVQRVIQNATLHYSNKYHTQKVRRAYCSDLLPIICDGVMYLILGWRVISAGLSVGDFSMYLTSVGAFSNSVFSFFCGINSLLELGLFAREYRYCFEMSDAVDSKAVESFPGFFHKIEFRAVAFRYPNTDRYILKDFNLTIQKGETLSIIGLNGAGKTTFVKLLCRFYTPTNGMILLDDMPIEKIPHAQYVQLISAVFQDFKLFAFNVAENIAVGEVDLNKLSVCIKKSGLEQKINELPLGIDTPISREFDMNGIEFSGGDEQKLAIARAIYKDNPIVILDEPTSALDPIEEFEIYEKFHTLVHGKTAIYISHRLASARFTDKIAFFEGGVLPNLALIRINVHERGPISGFI